MVELGPNPQLEPRPDLTAPRWVALANVLGNRHPDLSEDEILDRVNQFIDDGGRPVDCTTGPRVRPRYHARSSGQVLKRSLDKTMIP